AATSNAGCGRPPSPDVRLILITHANRLSVDRCLARCREVEHELVAVVHEAPAVDRLVVTNGEVVIEIRARTGERLLDGDRLDPVNGVLQSQVRSDRLRDVDRGP